MNAVILAILIIGGSTIASVLGMLLVRKYVPRQTREACHEVGGYLLAIIGTLYAILVGLIVVNSQGKVDTASQMAVSEANMLSHIYHLSRSFKNPGARNIRAEIHNYAVAAVNQDWTKVENGKEKEATTPSYQLLWKEIIEYVPEGANEEQCYAAMLSNVEQLSTSRKYRMVSAHSGLSPILWNVLIGGGVMIVLFTYFFFLENLVAQLIMTAFVAIFLSMNIYLIYVCQDPYIPELGAKDAGFGSGFDVKWFEESHFTLAKPDTKPDANTTKQ